MPSTDPSWPTGRYARFTRLWKFCPGLGQGLALPISIMPADFTATLTIGLDVTATLHVKKYELPVKDTGTGKCDQKCEYINLIPKTDELRLQSNLDLRYGFSFRAANRSKPLFHQARVSITTLVPQTVRLQRLRWGITLHLHLLTNINAVTPHLRQNPVDLLIYDERGNDGKLAEEALEQIRRDVAR